MDDLRSDFLFAVSSPLYGIARFFDFAGSFDSYNRSRSEEEADTKALLCDWYIVGQDLKSAMKRPKDS